MLYLEFGKEAVDSILSWNYLQDRVRIANMCFICEETVQFNEMEGSRNVVIYFPT